MNKSKGMKERNGRMEGNDNGASKHKVKMKEKGKEGEKMLGRDGNEEGK